MIHFTHAAQGLSEVLQTRIACCHCTSDEFVFYWDSPKRFVCTCLKCKEMFQVCKEGITPYQET